MSNFNWTDKESIRWFILLPTGHEGPYSFNQLLIKQIPAHTKIWAEGLSEPFNFKKVQELLISGDISEFSQKEIVASNPDELPPPLPFEDTVGKTEEIQNVKWGGKLLVTTILIAVILFYQLFQTQKIIKIQRPSKMSPASFSKIEKDLKFNGWNKKIFFKEYVSADLTAVWFFTESFHRCDIQATFSSVDEKLLINKLEKVIFKTKSELRGHLVEFKKFTFSEGSRVIPGMYNALIRAENCRWDGILPWAGNYFTSPDEEYVTNLKVILYPNGPLAFHETLGKLLKKKIDEKLKSQHHEQMFWEDLQQKLQTILAISLQIEQSFYDFISIDNRKFQNNLPRFVSAYTKRYGHFLTKFVVSNEEYSKELEKAAHLEIGTIRKYESLIRLTAKSVGLESMKIIEEFQKLKAPPRAQLNVKKTQIAKTFEKIKTDINKKIIQISEERSISN